MWRCEVCTLLNEKGLVACSACDARNPDAKESQAALDRALAIKLAEEQKKEASKHEFELSDFISEPGHGSCAR